jgi:uncharacterized membrane protein YgdD (TMEM256/DUF423 family)
MLPAPDARLWIILAALSGAASVALGAFAAHGVDTSTPAGLKAAGWLETGSRYQAIHALAMLAIVMLAARLHPGFAAAAQSLFITGTLLFCGALYVMALGGPRWMGAVAPIGGLSFIAGWLSLAVSALYRTS